MVSHTTDRRATLEVAALRRLGDEAGVQTWPVVLDMWSASDDAAELAHVDAAADRELHALGLVEDGEPIAWMATALRVLGAAERQLEIRTVTSARTERDIPRMRRVCLARNGHDHVLAARDGVAVDVRLVELSSEDEVGGLVARELDSASAPASFAGFSAPADDLAGRLADCATAHDAADALHALGAPGSDAVAIAAALMSCHTRSEIVAVSWSGGVSTQSSGALAVFDTDRGRVVASPSKSPDGRVWTTLSPGGGHRIAQAVGLLIETLPEGRWMP
ncbi:ESX secretion-associated protein EspG [Gordonia sp. OPL2]|uniref:ESX secretion-associated protein EspG n=1 Tax=Gordonia sp. OPL2 TaxID=2486274 RepID=UPI001655F622|nr:ESX secretion-associated protein EspG [Gordonia sp. OPL2]ROZ83454.1 ESX secretion-associated protein EspG [Gordonia sp. OPL2]